MKVYLFMVLSLITLFGCKKENTIKNGIIVSRIVRFSIVNVEDDDLLDLKNGFIDTSQIKIYYMIDGKKILYQEPRYDYFKSGWRYLEKSEYNTPKNQIAIACNSSELNGKSVTYVNWKENYRDTIEATFLRPNGISGSLIIDKVWLNGTFLWDRVASEGKDPNFVLRK